MMRKPIAIAILPETKDRFGDLYAIADDGSIWAIETRSNDSNSKWQSGWQRLPDLPQESKK
jgi:hypothetical protein